MEITQVVLAVVAVLAALVVGLAAIVPTLLELPGEREGVDQRGHRARIGRRPGRHRPRAAAALEPRHEAGQRLAV
jgi:hypothetical protein